MFPRNGYPLHPEGHRSDFRPRHHRGGYAGLHAGVNAQRFSTVQEGTRFLKNFRDYITLTKPRLNSLAILTTLAGFYMGSPSPIDWHLLLFTLLGTTGVAAGCGALNQWFEADADKKMTRTKKRPLPTGRLSPSQAFWFG